MSTNTIESPLPFSSEPNPDGLTTIERQVAESSSTFKPFEPAAPPPPSDWQALYQQERKRNADLEAVMAVAKIQPTAAHPEAEVKVKTYEQARAQLGPARWYKLSDGERLVTMGQDPNQDRAFISKLWGKGADPRLSADLHKTNPRKYRETREAALALDLFNK